jgi:hypothetical protein
MGNKPTTALDTFLPELARKLRRASAVKQRAASLVACEVAIVHAKVNHPLVDEVLANMRSAEPVSAKKRCEVEALVEEFDDQYFALQSIDRGNRAEVQEFFRRFRQARAVSALFSALKDDPLDAASEAIYQAAEATDKPDGLFSAINAALD